MFSFNKLFKKEKRNKITETSTSIVVYTPLKVNTELLMRKNEEEERKKYNIKPTKKSQFIKL